MARYQIKDNQTGKTVTIESDTPPTEADAEGIFQQAGLREQGGQSQSSNPLMGILNTLAPQTVKQYQGGIENISGGINKLSRGKYGKEITPEQAIQNVEDVKTNTLKSGAELAQYIPVTGTGFAGKLATGALRGAAAGYSKDDATLGSITRSSAGYAAGEAIIGSILEKGGKYVSDALKAKTINPTKIAGFLRDEAAKTTPNIDATKIIEAGDKAAKLYPHGKSFWETEKTAFTKNMPTKDLLNKLTSLGRKTWNMNETVKDKASSDITQALYKVGRENILSQAPEVAKYTASLKAVKELPGMVKAAQSGTWFLLKLLGIGKIAGL